MTFCDETPTVASAGKDNAGNAVQNVVYRSSGMISISGPVRCSGYSQILAVLEQELRHDDGAAAKAHFGAGRPIYYVDYRFEDEMVRKWPDGTRELVTLDQVEQAVRVRRAPVGLDGLAHQTHE